MTQLATPGEVQQDLGDGPASDAHLQPTRADAQTGETKLTERPMSRLHSGEVANVCCVGGGHTARRLAEIGFVPGATVEMLRRGDPCIVRLEHARLSLGGALQGDVMVTGG